MIKLNITIEELSKKLDALEKEYLLLVAQEKILIIEDMKEKIAQFGITSEDLGFNQDYLHEEVMKGTIGREMNAPETPDKTDEPPEWLKDLIISGKVKRCVVVKEV